MPTPSQASAFSRRLAKITASKDLDTPSAPETPEDYIKEPETPSPEDQDVEDLGDPTDETLGDEDVDLLELDDPEGPAQKDTTASTEMTPSMGLQIRLLEPTQDEEPDEIDDADDSSVFQPHPEFDNLDNLEEFQELAKDVLDQDDNPELLQFDGQPDPEDEEPLGITAEDLGDVDSDLLGDEINEDEDESDEEGNDDEDEGENSQDLKMFDLLSSFLSLNPSPSDEQFHSLADALGLPHEELEAHIYRLVGVMLEDDDIEDDTREILSSFIK
jgi:hypothetical protein